MPFRFYQFVFVLLSNAEDIKKQADELVAFVRSIVAQLKEAGALSWVLSEDDASEVLADQFPSITACAANFEPTALSGKGIFRDFIKFIISNPDKVVEWVEIIRDLFGLEAPQVEAE